MFEVKKCECQCGGFFYTVPEAGGPIADEAKANVIAASFDLLDELLYFCWRVQQGTIRSRRTYARYSEIVTRLTGKAIDDAVAEYVARTDGL